MVPRIPQRIGRRAFVSIVVVLKWVVCQMGLFSMNSTSLKSPAR